MITIRQILARKGSHIFGVSYLATAAEAASAMSSYGVGALAVRNGEAIVGLLSERDLVLCLAENGSDVAGITVMAAMHPPLEIEVDEDIQAALGMMTDRRRRHLLARDGERIVGMVSIGDLVKAGLEEQAGTITSLHQYITG